MSRADGPYVARLPREPRRKDNAYAHLFGGPIESAPPQARIEAPTRDIAPARDTLEQRVTALEQELEKLKRDLGVG